jgi:hypothetical protein
MITAVNFLNTHKEGIKSGAGCFTTLFGIQEIFVSSRTKREIAADDWIETASKAATIFARLSFVLSAALSKPGIFAISKITGALLKPEQLARFFGPNTLFSINPWHPRHVVSFVSIAFAAPALIRSAYHGVHGAFGNGHTSDQNLSISEHAKLWFNFITSRPILHWGNRLAHRILA